MNHDQKMAVKVAACIGSKFKLDMLRDVMNSLPDQRQLSRDEVLADLRCVVVFQSFVRQCVILILVRYACGGFWCL